MNFLFWNLQKNNSFFDLICEMVKENSIGVAMFAEFPSGEQERLLMKLKKVYPSFRYLQSIKPFKSEPSIFIMGCYSNQIDLRTRLMGLLNSEQFVMPCVIYSLHNLYLFYKANLCH